ncbi:MAG: T9SS type A sorting domain-containing protein, partial [Saprospiraceae bacterium]
NNRKGDFITNVGNTLSYSLRSKFHQLATSYVPQLKVISLDVPGNGSIAPDLTRSDHFAFWLKNIPALMITDAANFRNKYYHTIKDSVQYLNFNFMSQVTKASIATLLELAETQHGVSTEFSVDLGTAIQNGVNEKITVSDINNILQLNSTITINDAIIKIYSVSGKLIETHEIDILSNQANPLTTIQMPSGIYFITLTSDLLKWSGKYFNNGN